ncbi:hypothetical protein EVAR_9539_1 [Eumeta japonica]|uniref:Uncharacterized protein n=1 Tax=Eumeta variegata TaxID=151549 RepID=A0A4C1U3Y1_EUMVA|nr:hypothetical protein EVAR_9539_1 [Eumeta japonica]
MKSQVQINKPAKVQFYEKKNETGTKNVRPDFVVLKHDMCLDANFDQIAEPSDVQPHVVLPPESQKQESASSPVNAFTDSSTELEGGHQTFFPSFSSLFEPRQNLRLGFNNQEAAYSQRPNSYRSLLNYPLFGGFRGLDNFGKSTNAPAPLVDASAGLLGSGNFGVIRGGTFFAQNDAESDFSDGFSSFYNNGHGRPSLGYNANPRPNYNQDQFANFRDFADINTPSNSAYSHFVVVYANKNATADEVSEETRKIVSEPKNIIETLELLDKTETKKEHDHPKISKVKAKLAATKPKIMSKMEQWKKPNTKSHKHELEEPLLALS